jgi:hypothetical protein
MLRQLVKVAHSAERQWCSVGEADQRPKPNRSVQIQTVQTKGSADEGQC